MNVDQTLITFDLLSPAGKLLHHAVENLYQSRFRSYLLLEETVNTALIEKSPYFTKDDLPLFADIKKRIFNTSRGQSALLEKITILCENLLLVDHNLFENFPVELINVIFSQLSIQDLRKVRRVNKAFNKCADKPQLIAHFINTNTINLSIEKLEKLTFHCGNFIRVLDFPSLIGQDKISFLSNSSLGSIIRSCPQLQFLNLQGCMKLTGPELTVSQYALSQLTDLSISSCTNFQESILIAILVLCSTKLQRLNIGGCSQLTNITLLAIAVHCRNVTNLNLWACYKCSIQGLHILAENIPTLTDLSINHCDHFPNKDLITLFPKIQNIKSLNLSNCPQITDETLKAIGDNCHHLEILELSSSQNITMQGIENLLMICPKLEKFRIAGSNNPSINIAFLKRSYPHIIITK